MKALILAAAILAALYLARDPGELTRGDAEYCARVTAGAHTNFRGIDCAAAIVAHAAAVSGK